MLRRDGLWDNSLSQDQANRSTAGLGFNLAMPSSIVKPATIATNSTKVLKSNDYGKIIGWGESQSSEAIEQTINVIKNITKSQVKGWAKQGLTKDWVKEQLVKYTGSLAKGGKKLNNKQLLHRKELMEKILELW